MNKLEDLVLEEIKLNDGESFWVSSNYMFEAVRLTNGELGRSIAVKEYRVPNGDEK